MISCHLIFALVLPKFPNLLLAYSAIVVLGVSFSLVPAALWPSVPKLMPERYLGSAYSLIFWVQNVGLCIVPMLIGIVLNSTNPGVSDAFENKNMTKTLQEKVDYMSDIYALEAEITAYEEFVAQNNNTADMPTSVENDGQESAANVDYSKFDVNAKRAELDALKANKAKQGISDSFDYEASVAEIETLKAEKIEKNYPDNPKYNYTTTMLIFVSFGVLALLFGLWLKREDSKKGYGLELPNIKE
jgi:hypothetical protein